MKIKSLEISNKIVLAPLANFSDHAFRILCRRLQAAMVFTQKFTVNALVNKFKEYEAELQVYSEEHPIFIQLIGNDPQVFSSSMELLNSYDYDGFDLNLGWPAPDALRYDFGGALLKHPEKILPLLRAIMNATNKPVSVKIRTGYDKYSINALEVSKLIESEGADFITIHGRTVEAGYSGEVNLNLIRLVKEQINIPVIGNGDIIDGASAQRMLDITKCDLLMVGRAAMKNPRIFLELNNYLRGKVTPPISQNEYKQLLQDYKKLTTLTNSSQSLESPFFQKYTR